MLLSEIILTAILVKERNREALKEKYLRDTLMQIEKANDLEINEIIHALIRRYQKVYPGWEVVFLSLPKDDPAERKRILEHALHLDQQ